MRTCIMREIIRRRKVFRAVSNGEGGFDFSNFKTMVFERFFLQIAKVQSRQKTGIIFHYSYNLRWLISDDQCNKKKTQKKNKFVSQSRSTNCKTNYLSIQYNTHNTITSDILLFYNTMFFLKDTKQTPQQTFDQSTLQITIHHGPSQLQQVRLGYKWASSHFNCRLPAMRCQWFNKSAQSMDLIEGVEGQSYQPSIVDVGTTLYIQMVPQSKDMEYIGMPLTKFIGPIQLAPQTEEQVTELIQAGKSTYFVEVKEIKVQKLSLRQQELQGGQAIRDTLLKIVKNKMILTGKFGQGEKSQTIKQVAVKKDYPKLIIERGSAKMLVIHFGESEWVKLQLQNNKIRDVLYLLVQKMKENGQNEKQEEKKQEVSLQKTQPSMNQKQINEIEVIKNQQIPAVGGQQTKSYSANQLQLNCAEESEKKALQRLPLSPQSKQVSKDKKQQHSNQIQLKTTELYTQNQTLLRQNNAALQIQIKTLKQSIGKLTDSLKKLSAQKFQSQQQVCYFKNQCRIQQQQISQLRSHTADLNSKLDILNLKTSIKLKEGQSQHKYEPYLSLNYQQLLDLIFIKQQEIQQQQCKLNYHRQHTEQLQNQAKDLSDRLQTSQTTIRKLQRKIQSLIESKHTVQQPGPQRHTHTHQLGSYEFEISKLREQLNILQRKRKEEGQSKQRLIEGLRVQIKELIQENTYLRSKEKSSKGELKNELVELKKLINRFAQSIAEKDMQIDHLKQANKELGKGLQGTKI